MAKLKVNGVEAAAWQSFTHTSTRPVVMDGRVVSVQQVTRCLAVPGMPTTAKHLKHHCYVEAEGRGYTFAQAISELGEPLIVRLLDDAEEAVLVNVDTSAKTI